MPKKQQHPVSIETINNSVVFHTSSNGEAKHIADLLTRLITTMPSNLCLEDIVDMFQQKRGKILLRKYKDPLTVCVTKIPKDDNHDFYLWRGLKVQAQCPECQLTDYYSNETTAYEMLSMHMANEHSYEHSRLSNKFERARWRNDFTSMKNNWV